MPILAIIGREDTNRNLNNPRQKLFPLNLFVLKVSVLLITKFELAATITPTGRTCLKDKLETAIKK